MRPLRRAAFFLTLAGSLLAQGLEAQHGKLLLDQRSRWNDARKLMQADTLPPMGVKPWDAGTLGEKRPRFRESDTARTLFHRKLFQEHLLRVEEGPLTMSVDPLLHLEWGRDLADPTAYGDTTMLYRNQRGFQVQGRIGERIAFSSRFRESQVFLPRYLRDYVGERGVVPGQGRYKVFEGNGFDHSMASGRLSIFVADWLTITGGHGKHFIGEGYRSLLLSDNAFNYPFLEFQHQWWDGRIAYRNIYTGFMSLERMPKGDAPEALFKPKAGTFHYLDIRLFPWFRLGLFEGTIRYRYDSTGTRSIDPSTLSPLIFTNTLVQGFDGKHNVVTGIDLRARLNEHFLLYGQFVLDDPDRGRHGQQIGTRIFDAGIENLDLLLEYNRLMPRTFTHEQRLQHYGHYGQPLAHPLGTDFQEFVIRTDLTLEPFFLRLSYNYALPKGERASEVLPVPSGKDPDRLEVQHQRASFGVIVNPQNRSELSISIWRRTLKGAGEDGVKETLYLGLSFRTSLSNSYSDL